MTEIQMACAGTPADPNQIAALWDQWIAVCEAVPCIPGRPLVAADNLLFMLRLAEFERRVRSTITLNP